MQDFLTVIDNRILIVSVLACFTAQFLKPFIELARHGKFNVRSIIEAGGMPSSHSAMVTALAGGVGQSAGWASTEFAIACVFAIIVMYDAMGIRQAAGLHARRLNQLVDELLSDRTEFSEERLKELLGHTPWQVLIGSIVGAAVSWLASPAY
jgi:uncharacterized protein